MKQPATRDQAGSAFAYRRGTCPVIITAPHCYPHWRKDRFKLSERETGFIARNVARRVHCHSLVTKGAQAFDANFDESCPFKDKLSSVVTETPVRLVLDLHGAAPERTFGFAIGTNDGGTELGNHALVELLASALRELDCGLPVVINPKGQFGARHPYTVSRFSAEHLRVPAIQVEMNMQLAPRWREIATVLARFIRLNF
jgi:hypothetical protein